MTLPSLSSSQPESPLTQPPPTREGDAQSVITQEVFKRVPRSKETCIYDLSRYGRTEVHNLRVCYINGIDTSFLQARTEAIHVSNCLGGINVHGVYNPTNGVIPDIVASVAAFCRKKTKVERKLHLVWDNFFDSHGNDGLLLQICSSEGAIYVRNALESYSPEKRKKIVILGLAPACYISPELCHSITNYQTALDLTPKLDLVGLLRFWSTSNLISSHLEENPVDDHSPLSLTYIHPIQRTALSFFNAAEVFNSDWVEVEPVEENFMYEGFTVIQGRNEGESLIIKLKRESSEVPLGPVVDMSIAIAPDFSDRSFIAQLDVCLDIVSKISQIGMQTIIAVQFPAGRVGMFILAGCNTLDLGRYITINFTKPNTYSCRNLLRALAIKMETPIRTVATAGGVSAVIQKVIAMGSASPILFLSGDFAVNLFLCLRASIPQMELAFERGVVHRRENEGDQDDSEEGNIVNRDIETYGNVSLLKGLLMDLIGSTAFMAGYGCFLLSGSSAATQSSTNSTLNNITTCGNSTASTSAEGASPLDILNIVGNVAIAGTYLCSTIVKVIRVRKLLGKRRRKREDDNL